MFERRNREEWLRLDMHGDNHDKDVMFFFCHETNKGCGVYSIDFGEK